MEHQNNAAMNFRRRNSPSSDHFLNVFSPPQSDPTTLSFSSASSTADELNEHDVFWNSDEPHHRSPAADTTSPSNENHHHNPRHPFHHPENSGILAALPDKTKTSPPPLLQRKPSAAVLTPSPKPSIPKPPLEKDPHYKNALFSQSVPGGRRFQHSAPVNVPPAMMMRKKTGFDDYVEDDDCDGPEEEMLPPHEIVARGKSPKTTFSVLEGVGRTLKGRDLRQVRNAVWRQTGFID